MFRILTLITFSIAMLSCSQSEDDTASSSSSAATPGNAIQDVSTAMSSVSSLLASSQLVSSYLDVAGGVANSYCNGNGAPLSGGSEISSSSNNYASAIGYCQSTHNAQSPDTPRGAMYIAGAIGCLAQNRGLFTTPGTSTETINIDTTCFGSSDEVAALVTDMGGATTISGASMTVAALADSHPFDYSLVISGVGDNDMTVYIKSSDNQKAALMDESGAPWYVLLDEANGILYYEGINTTNNRRMRVRIEGTLSDGSFSAVSSINGFWLQGSSSSYSNLVTFTGSPTTGILGNLYSNGQSANEGNCYLPAGTANCTGLTAISSSDSQASSLYSSMSSDATNLVSNTTSILTFSTVDPSDGDITQ